jgi:pyroglutamyl-peptidase
MKTVVVAGFGSFDQVINNPSASIAEALDGCMLGDIQVVGREMPVSYQRSIDVCALWLESTEAVGLVGIGVAMQRTEITVERVGTQPSPSARDDVDHRKPEPCADDSPKMVKSTVDVERLALGLGAVVGDDAGEYVCNAWLYQAVRRFDVPVAFIHVPPLGIDSGKLLSVIRDLWGE